MQNIRTLLLLLLGVACSVGACRAPASSDASASPTVTPVPDGMGRIYFYRKSGFGGAALKPTVMLNGVPAGQSAPGVYFVVDREPGRYEAKCSVLMEHAISFDLAAGQTIYVETRTTMGIYAGHVRPQIVDAGTGASGVSKCRRTGGS